LKVCKETLFVASERRLRQWQRDSIACRSNNERIINILRNGLVDADKNSGNNGAAVLENNKECEENNISVTTESFEQLSISDVDCSGKDSTKNHPETMQSPSKNDMNSGLQNYPVAAMISSWVNLITTSDLLAAVSSVTPSALREVAIEVPTVRWTDIGGMEPVKESLREVVEWPLLYPDIFRSIGISPPKVW